MVVSWVHWNATAGNKGLSTWYLTCPKCWWGWGHEGIFFELVFIDTLEHMKLYKLVQVMKHERENYTRIEQPMKHKDFFVFQHVFKRNLIII